MTAHLEPSPDKHGFYWKKSPGSLELDISWAQYAIFERSAQDLGDGTLAQQAEKDPLATYKMIRKMLGSAALRGDGAAVHVNGITCEYDETEEGKRQSQQAAITLVESLPDGSEAFEFKLRAYPSREDIDILGVDPSERSILLEARVEPQNLAF